MTSMVPQEALQVLSPSLDILRDVLNVSPQQIGEAEVRVRDLEEALKEKKEQEQKSLIAAADINAILEDLYRVGNSDDGNVLLDAIIMVLQHERDYHLDQANRAHVQREEGRLKEARSWLQLLIAKRRLASALSGATRSGR